MPQNNQQEKIVCPECGKWLGMADVNSVCRGIKIYCKKCKKDQPITVPSAGKAS